MGMLWLAEMLVLSLLQISNLNCIEMDHFLIPEFGKNEYLFGTLMRKWELDILLPDFEATLKLNHVFSQYREYHISNCTPAGLKLIIGLTYKHPSVEILAILIGIPDDELKLLVSWKAGRAH